MVIRTIENVGDFSDIRHSYLKNLTASTRKRREKLLQDHYFFCECTGCMDTNSDNLKNSLKCSSCKGCIPVKSGVCTECGQKVEQSKIDKYRVLKNRLDFSFHLEIIYRTRVRFNRGLYFNFVF